MVKIITLKDKIGTKMSKNLEKSKIKVENLTSTNKTGTNVTRIDQISINDPKMIIFLF